LNNFNKFLLLKIVSILYVVTLVSCSHFNTFKDDSVSKEKYEELLKKYKDLIGQKVPQKTGVIIDDALAVEEFRAKLIKTTKQESTPSQSYDLRRVQKDISLLYQAYDKYRKKEFGDVIIILKELENSQVSKVRAQARYLLAITMNDQGEHDIAMQIFEEIVLHKRNSIFALLSLNRLIDVTRQLGLMKKNEYFSQLYARFLK